MNEIIANVARNMNDHALLTVARAIEAELLAAFASGTRGTQAHVGQLELLTACSNELAERGYRHGEKITTFDVCYETVLGDDDIRLSFAIRCF